MQSNFILYRKLHFFLFIFDFNYKNFIIASYFIKKVNPQDKVFKFLN